MMSLSSIQASGSQPTTPPVEHQQLQQVALTHIKIEDARVRNSNNLSFKQGPKFDLADPKCQMNFKSAQ